jgi:hypothetical protein
MLDRQLAMPFAVRKFEKSLQRRSRRKFIALGQNGPYRLPRAVQEQLEKSLTGSRNADTAYALAVFLGRFWSAPNRLDVPFPIDRRALADHRDLDLSEAKIRGAIKTLERVGFLDRAIAGKGSRFRLKGTELHRKPVLFQFGVEFREAFSRANKRAKIANPTRRALPSRSPSLTTNSPKKRIPNPTVLLMGDVTKASERTAAPIAPNPRLEDAIARLGHAIREARA